jgi:hypothetical protein
MIGLFIVSLITPFPGDDIGGAQGLLFMLAGAYSLATGHWVHAEWLRIALASFGVMLGSLTVVLGWLG